MTRTTGISHSNNTHIYSGVASTTPASTFEAGRLDRAVTVAITIGNDGERSDDIDLYFAGENGLAALESLIRAARRARGDMKASLERQARDGAR